MQRTTSFKCGVTGTVSFTNPGFGDPLPAVAKAGYYRTAAAPTGGWTAQWIWQPGDHPANTWLRLRKKVTLSAKPTSAAVRMAAENKYWLYVNGQLVAPDGGLDLRPDLTNTYYDSLDIAPYLTAGDNVIAALVWYKGGVAGYSQQMKSEGGLLFEAAVAGATPAKIVSDSTWKVWFHPSFARTVQTHRGTGLQVDPVPGQLRRAQRSGRLDGGFAFNDGDWPAATQKGTPPSAPWNSLVNGRSRC
jgi:hypothetical protein